MGCTCPVEVQSSQWFTLFLGKVPLPCFLCSSEGEKIRIDHAGGSARAGHDHFEEKVGIKGTLPQICSLVCGHKRCLMYGAEVLC